MRIPISFYLVLSALLLNAMRVQGQATIKFDPGNPSLINFDQPFILQVDSVKMGSIISVSIYEIGYTKGKSEIRDREFPDNPRPSFTLTGDLAVKLIGTSLKINMPALRPDKDFDLLIKGRFSKDHLKQALKINQELHKNKTLKDPQLLADTTLSTDYATLYNAVNQVPGSSKYPMVVFDYNLVQYRNSIYRPLEATYDKLTANTGLLIPKATDFFSQGEINELHHSIDQNVTVQYHIGSLQNILTDSHIKEVFNGQLSAAYHLPVSPADVYAMDVRIANLTSSQRFLDSLAQYADLLPDHAGNSYKKIHTKIRILSDTLKTNVAEIKELSDQINQAMAGSGVESLWLTQGTQSSDLKTTSTRHFTLDVGVADIMAYDNKNHYTHIPKLFFGLDYFFPSVNKNTDWKKIPDPGPPGPKESHYLESRYSFWQRFSITGGFMLGAMQNKDFDNVYNNLSFTLGPSYRIGKYIKFSFGGAVLKRFDTEPITTNSRVILGTYAGLSLDYDLLSAASNVTSMIFK